MADGGLVSLANDLLAQLHVPSRVQHWSDINASVFVTLFEGLCGENLPDVIRNPRCREDEIHNCQSVIDTLSLDILNTSLSHITGEDVVDGVKLSIANLLEVLSGLLEYIIDKIGSDVSSEIDGNDTRDRHSDIDPDLLTSDVIDDVLERELGRSYSNNRTRPAGNNDGNSWQNGSRGANSTDDLIALGNVDSSWTRQGSPEKTADLIELGAVDGSGVVPPGGAPRMSDISGNTPPSRGPNSKHPVGNNRVSVPRTTADASNGLLDEDRDPPRSLGLDPRRREEMDDLAASIEGIRHTEHSRKVPSDTNKSLDTAPTTSPALSTGLNSSITSSVNFPHAPPALTTALQAPGKGPGQFEDLGIRPRPQTDRLSSSLPMDDSGSVGGPTRSGVHHTYTHHLYHHYSKVPSASMSSSLPITSTFGDNVKSPKTQSASVTKQAASVTKGSASASTVLLDSDGQPVKSSLVSGAPSKPRTPVKNGPAYENLENLMRDTVEFSRAAVKSSPLKERPASANSSASTGDDRDAGDRYKEMSKALRSALKEVDVGNSQPSSRSDRQPHRKSGTRQTNVTATRPRQHTYSSRGHSSAAAKSILSPGRRNGGKKNVSFVTSKSLSSSESSLDRSRTTRSRKANAALRQPDNLRTVHTSSTETSLEPGQPEAQSEPSVGYSSPDHKPATFREYLLKYYGRDRLRPASNGDTDGYDSDGAVDYYEELRNDTSQDADVSSLSAEIEEYKRQLRTRARGVRFDDILDDSAPGRMGGIRRKLKKEDQKSRLKAAFIDKVYEEQLVEYEEEMRERLEKTQNKAKEIEKMYKAKVLKEPKTKHRPAKKYNSSVGVMLPRSRSRKRSSSRAAGPRCRKRSFSASPSYGRKSTLHISHQEILPWLLEEFPYLHLSSETLHDMWRKSARQLEQLSKAERDLKRKRSKGQVQIDEADKKQTVMMNIMKKELEHNQRLRDIKERRRQVQSTKSKINEKRQQSARCRKYYEEYQVRMRSKMLKKRSREEQVFKSLFQEGLSIQKDRISELRRYAREQRQQRAKKQQDELESLENYYKDQFAMLAESMAREREDLDVRENAQSKVLDTMKKELRRKMEREIRDFQEQLYRDEDDTYYRQLDADRLRNQLHMARYQTAV